AHLCCRAGSDEKVEEGLTGRTKCDGEATSATREGREGGDGLTISPHQALRQLCGAAAVHKTCAKPRSGGQQRSGGRAEPLCAYFSAASSPGLR
ncbi:hypothetical protein ATANTOWER_007607, partial [Ataeniobius toweri]|nr:hypothetical protein [Ataeniobius toweri]